MHGGDEMTVRILKPADRLEWHGARKKFITASVAAVARTRMVPLSVVARTA